MYNLPNFNSTSCQIKTEKTLKFTPPLSPPIHPLITPATLYTKTNLPADLQLRDLSAPKQPRLGIEIMILRDSSFSMRAVHDDITSGRRRGETGVRAVEFPAGREPGLDAPLQVQRERRHFYTD